MAAQSRMFYGPVAEKEENLMEATTAHVTSLKLRCPSCGFELGNMPGLPTVPVACGQCGFSIAGRSDYWDACTDKSYPRDFAKQWLLWEAGKLGDPTLVYGHDPEHYFREFLTHTSLRPEQLASMKILEAGFGHGRLLQQIQKWSPSAYGIDLSKPLPSAHLRPGSAIFGNLLSIPFMPGQFDLVVCRGVVHHTPDPEASFGCVAEQVAIDGRLYFAGCYEPGKGMLFLRKFLPRSWNYPEPVLLALATVFSGVRALLEAARTQKFTLSALKRYYAHYKLDVFDVMAPRWSGTLSEDTVVPWFSSRGFEVCKVGHGSYVGVRKDSPRVLELELASRSGFRK